MENSINTKSSEDFIWVNTFGSTPVKQMSEFEFQVNMSDSYSFINNWICVLKPGLVLSVIDLKHRHGITNTVMAKENFLKFSFLLSGKGRVDYNFLNFKFKRNLEEDLLHHSYVYFTPEIEGKMECASKHRLYQFNIHISPDLLLTYFSGQLEGLPFVLRGILEGSDQASYLHCAMISAPMRHAIQQTLNCHFSGAMRKIFLESKAMELLTYKLDQIIAINTVNTGPSQPGIDDHRRIQKAVEILTRDFENPPGLHELARSIGTTHTRLNYCFKMMYGTTTFGYLRQIRLEKARQLIEKNGLNVTQAAYAVGYNSVPSFSSAFSDYFGTSPITFKKTRYG